MCTAMKHPVPDRVKLPFIIFVIQTIWRSALSIRVPGCQKSQRRLNLVWHMMLHSCTHMATVGVKGLKTCNMIFCSWSVCIVIKFMYNLFFCSKIVNADIWQNLPKQKLWFSVTYQTSVLNMETIATGNISTLLSWQHVERRWRLNRRI